VFLPLAGPLMHDNLSFTQFCVTAAWSVVGGIWGQTRDSHFLFWTFIVPWGASSLWFWLEGLRPWAKPDLAVGVGLLPVALLCGLYGVFFCSLHTLPAALLSYGILSQFPRLAQSGLSRVGFVAVTSLIGLGWSTYTAKMLNTGRTEYALLAVGFIAGAFLGMATVWLWSNSTVSSKQTA